MPGEDLQSWSPTAASNSNADSAINWAEGQARASVNDSARSMMAAHAKDRNLHNGSIVTAGTANAQTFSSGVSYTAIPTGLRVLLKIGPGLTNTASITLNMDGIGAVTVKNLYGNDLTGGELVADCYHEFIYNGTNWVLLVSPSALVLLSAQTATNAAAVDFTNLFTGTYTHYMWDIRATVSNNSSTLNCRVSSDNGASWVATNYIYEWIYVSSSAPVTSGGGTSGTGLFFSPAITTAAGSVIYGIMDLMTGGYQTFRSWGYNVGAGGYYIAGSGLPFGGIGVNAFRFFANPGTVSGTFKMYGVRA